MKYPSILVHLEIDDTSPRRATAAWRLAGRFEADLIGFCARETYMPAAMSTEAGFEAEVFAQQLADIESNLEVARVRFEKVTGDSERASWRGIVGDPTRLLTTNARAADLVVTGLNDTLAGSLSSVDIGALVLSAGRPVLLLGDDRTDVEADRILVGWKDTREARRAVTDALPFLTRATDVLVASVEEGDRPEAEDSLADVVRFLLKHGVNARSELLSSSRHAGDALLETAHAMKADLVVAGGFGHSRLREWVFGGVTSTLVANGSVHRLLSN